MPIYLRFSKCKPRIPKSLTLRLRKFPNSFKYLYRLLIYGWGLCVNVILQAKLRDFSTGFKGLLFFFTLNVVCPPIAASRTDASFCDSSHNFVLSLRKMGAWGLGEKASKGAATCIRG